MTRAKGLGELRTATTRHIAAKPPRKGTNYLDLFTLSMEKNRLEQELAGLERRRKRILDRLAEVQRTMENLNEAAQSSSAKPTADQQAVSIQQPGGRQWKRMPVEY